MLRSLAMPLWLDNSTVFRYFRNYTKKGNIELPTEVQSVTKMTQAVSPDEEQLMAMAINDGESLQEVLQYLPLEDFQNIEHRVYNRKVRVYIF